ncbi:hypothetical protein [Mucilaginibacter sp.]|uniref:hypothetical protein n=1 Tax=Mucilaginibacter sp. TaxID=1882438 RepID=UPI002C77ABAC|nr:hypothetical protein [Mucilaginibacter sp.]HTI57947.1 hypothetical protein [Mucilaginibacter sp.]
MKNLKMTAFAALAFMLASTCHFGRHTTIVETGDNYHLRIEYAGKIHFNYDGTAISDISRGGYVKYERNDETLEAKNDGHGGVNYELYDHGEQVDPQAEGKAFIARAVRVMLQKNHRPNWK